MKDKEIKAKKGKDIDIDSIFKKIKKSKEELQI